jgi:predicted DsbA family dithiol-disulfide isomerase
VAPAPASQPIFFYDLGSPACYLVAEGISTALPVVPEWEPVLGEDFGRAEVERDRAAIERLAVERGLLALKWPANWPTDSRCAMLAATYAKRLGRTVAFSLAAFRQAFAAGRDLSDRDTVLIAGAACEMHPTALLKALTMRSTAQGLERATARARAAGVRSLPAVQLDGALFEGEWAAIEAAAAACDLGRGD